jgi:hypothetical protein
VPFVDLDHEIRTAGEHRGGRIVGKRRHRGVDAVGKVDRHAA